MEELLKIMPEFSKDNSFIGEYFFKKILIFINLYFII